jgi:hypothetical protein
MANAQSIEENWAPDTQSIQALDHLKTYGIVAFVGCLQKLDGHAFPPNVMVFLSWSPETVTWSRESEVWGLTFCREIVTLATFRG